MPRMTSRELLGRLLAFALALLLFAGAYVFAFVLGAILLESTGDFDVRAAEREDAIWFVLLAAMLWVAVGLLIGRWWVLAVPLVPYAWERGRELLEYGDVDFHDGAAAHEVWLVIAVCALGIGCGLRVWATARSSV